MKPRILVTGGAGFIGTNLVHRLLSEGHPVCILDNLSRRNVNRNLSWLLSTHSDLLKVEIGDVRDREAVRRTVREADHVFHLAGQVAVTTSVDEPIPDFETNVVGTLNLLEEIRAMASPPSILYTSTNKVYGALEDLPLRSSEKRYLRDTVVDGGIGEACPLSFHSPYGCSKGAAEQYVLDYHRTYGIRSVVFRMSCIYGPHQFGNEDQGWVAHIMSRALAGEPVTIYGDGRQVRDILHIDDLVNAQVLAFQEIGRLAGTAFNIGGGPENTISLLELIEVLDRLHIKPPISFSKWRIGDQKYYVSDTSRFSAKTGWKPQVDIQNGIRSLYCWLVDAQGSKGQESLLRESA